MRPEENKIRLFKLLKMHLNSVLQLKYVSAGVFLLQRIKARMDTCSSVIYFIPLEDFQNIFYIL